MFNAEKPSLEELPSSAQLLRSTIIAAVSALVILVTVVMPAEYGIDPTGIGRVLGLTEMGEIKQELAKEAEEEGQTAAKIAFEQVAKIEAHHRERYKKLVALVEAGTVYKREQPIKWKCAICGYIVEGTEPPPKCPSCKNPKEFYEPANMDF